MFGDLPLGKWNFPSFMLLDATDVLEFVLIGLFEFRRLTLRRWL
jgi:hypothetical protein